MTSGFRDLHEVLDMHVRFTLSLLSLALTSIILTACSDSRPQCQKDPPFYLRGTAYDCAATQPPGDTKAGQP
jgi:hypothetical protein